VVAEEPSTGEWASVEDAIAFIHDKVKGCCPPLRFSVRIEARGRVVKSEEGDAYEEDFFLRDATGVGYVLEEGWDYRHVARVDLGSKAISRFRRGQEPWQTSTILHVSFPFTEKSDADDVIRAWEFILAHPMTE
jgi:hypothetical protein